MQAALNKIDNRTLAIILITLSLVIAGAWYYFWYQPTLARIDSIEQEIQTLESKRQKGLLAKRRLPQLREQIAALEAEIQKFLAALPEEEKFHEVLDLLAQNAKETKVKLKSLNRSPTRSEIAEVSSIDVAINVEAPFPQLYSYLKRLESLRRYSSIKGVQLSATKQDTVNPPINANMTVRFYVYNGPRGEEEP